MKTLYDVPAPAKLNLFLHVTGRRADGYHHLQTVFRLIDLCDLLDFELRADGRIVCQTDLPGLAFEDNLIVRAARALQLASATPLGAQIHCRKQIPVGAGLGGGSSDAASTLIALNRLWNTGFSRQELMAIALSLGADVPVFVFGQSAFAQGIGEQLQALDLPQRSYVIVQPPSFVSTQAVFSSPNLTRNASFVIMPDFIDWQTQNSQASLTRSLPLFGRNDLQAVVLEAYPEVAHLGGLLTQMGLHARMTGSGACWFAEFARLDQAQACQQELATQMASADTQVMRSSWVCQGLHEHPLREWVCSVLGNRQAG